MVGSNYVGWIMLSSKFSIVFVIELLSSYDFGKSQQQAVYSSKRLRCQSAGFWDTSAIRRLVCPSLFSN